MTESEFKKSLENLDKIWELQRSLADKCRQYPSLIGPQRGSIGRLVPMLSDKLTQAFKDAGFNNVVHIIDKIRFKAEDSSDKVG